MTMTVTSNFASPNFLVCMNRNNARFAKSLIKLLRRDKLVFVSDNPSNYWISERMKAELRALNQADRNVQDGSTVIKIAKDSVHEIFEILQEMRSLALDAANDSNTDRERELLQKKMTQFIAAINDIAVSTRYNGKGLIDGTYDGDAEFAEETVVINKINPQDISLSPNETYIKEVFVNGARVVMNENNVKELTRSFDVTDTSIKNIPSDDKRSLQSNTKPKMDCDMGFSGRSPKSTWNWAEAYRDNVLAAGDSLIGGSFSKKEIGVEINFGSAVYSDAIPDAFHNQGFSILCNGCTQYINVVFDKTMYIGQGTLTTFENNVLRKDFRVGIKDATSLDDLPKAIFEGIKNSGRDPKDVACDTVVQSTGEVVAVTIDKGRHNFRIAKNPNYNNGSSSEYVFVKEYDWSMLFIDSGTILALGDEGSKDNLPQGTVVQELTNTQPEIQKINVDDNTTAQVWDGEEEVLKTTVTQGNPLIIQDGTTAGEYDAYYIKGMQTKNLKIGNTVSESGEILNLQDRVQYNSLSDSPEKQKEFLEKIKAEATKIGNIISIATVEGAKTAIKILDSSIEYVIENVAVLGAYLQQMHSDRERIYVMEKNTDLAISAIRDPDVKERIDYAKSHVLARATQFIFAQAEQHAFSVLHLTK